ncbi:uncharacterized protein LOC109841800 [Asparagus officinalis]|uniref:uncharacterized protein LOC109841800 n=1 Tax=Asparagus officinalis TaxID=4686 RepID=UPI00098E6427|nr:uncharacterized protein LOC109841800 [Asparagus officinalis]
MLLSVVKTANPALPSTSKAMDDATPILSKRALQRRRQCLAQQLAKARESKDGVRYAEDLKSRQRQEQRQAINLPSKTEANIMMEDEDKAMLLLCSLPDDEFSTFVLTMINGRTTVSYKEVTSALVNYELRKNDSEPSEKASGDALAVRGQEGHWKNECPKLKKGRAGKQREKVVQASEVNVAKVVGDTLDLDSSELERGDVVLMGNDHVCPISGISSVRIRMHNGVTRELKEVRCEDLFNQTSYWTVFPKLTVKRVLTDAAKHWLIKEVNYKEIRNALFQMNADKAPGPDGFNAYFYQQNWDIIKDDVVLAVQNFFSSGSLLKQINHTFLTLVPKSKEATSIQDYRPISCCNVIYKIITKILANRLKLVIGELISKNQHAFLQGRHIGECSLLAHELLRDFNKNHGKRACFKIDLHKAFDSINREFVYYIMHCMGFPVKWINWIRECLSTPSFSVLLNGSSSGFFKSNRGIRQGDPLSPYIFVLTMEFWSIGMELATISGNIQNFKTQQELQVSHILFADDMLVFCRANRSSFEGINNLLEAMALNTGLCINRKKSKLFFSKGCNYIGVLSSIVGISIGNLPMKYLGLPLSAKYPKAKDFLPLIDKIRYKIEGWMTHSLSFAGRLELVKAVLFSTSAYWYFVYKFPISIVQNLESIFANFLWNGKLHAISWKEVCRPKQEGGFGLRQLSDIGQAAALKLIWRLLTTNTLWSSWMKVRYVRGGNLWNSTSNLLDSGTWKHIYSHKEKALSCIRKTIGNGEATSLWFDPWLQEGRICELLSQLTPQLTGTSTWTVSNIIQNSQWNFILPCLSPLIPFITKISVSGQEDQWIWLHTGDGIFSFSSAWNQVRTHYNIFELYNVVWFPYSNPMMSCCMLRSLNNRLPTRNRLFRFGITSIEVCALCYASKETRDHLFFQCEFSAFIWKLCRLKLQLKATDAKELKTEALEIKEKFKFKDNTYILARLALNATVWHILQERNMRIFHDRKLHKIMVFRRIYEDINILLRTCNWKVGNSVILTNWGFNKR